MANTIPAKDGPRHHQNSPSETGIKGIQGAKSEDFRTEKSNNQSDVLCGLSNRGVRGPVYGMKASIASNQTDGYEADG